MAINLTKGQKISLKKDSGGTLTNMCIGINWGAIDTVSKGFLGFGGGQKKKEAVDLDASCAVFDENNNLLDVIYFGQLNSKDGAIKHSGDDLTGDVDGDDGLDNEVIMVDLSRVSPNATKIAFVLNSFRGQDFATIPFATIRIYEGTPSRVDNIFATFNIAGDPKYAGYVSMIMGRLYKRNGEWKFASIGEPTRDAKLEDTLKTVVQSYL